MAYCPPAAGVVAVWPSVALVVRLCDRRYGNSYKVADQKTSACSGSCPAGHFCRRKTAKPQECGKGTYCPAESAAETACPAGRFSPNTTAKSQDDCKPCSPGKYCPEGSKKEKDCSPGTYSSEYEQEQCRACVEGKYQPLEGKQKCNNCTAGSYCRLQSPSLGASEATACRNQTFSAPGETTCRLCRVDYFKKESATGELFDCVTCQLLEPGANCSETTTRGPESWTHGSMSLSTVYIEPSYWRLGSNSTTLYPCQRSATGSSSCVGGNNAGREDEYKLGYTGSGYCKKGHTGPLCRVCNTPDHYFDDKQAMECAECPKLSDRLLLPLGIVGGLLTLMLAAFAIKRFLPCPPRAHPSCHLHISPLLCHASSTCRFCSNCLSLPIKIVSRMLARVQNLDLMPRFKLLFAFYQVVSQVMTVYNVRLSKQSSDLYATSVPSSSFTNIDLDGVLHHTRGYNSLLPNPTFNHVRLTWQATSTLASASQSASALGCSCARSRPSCCSSPSRCASWFFSSSDKLVASSRVANG